MGVILLVVSTLFIVYCAKNKVIDGNVKTASVIIGAVIALGAIFIK